ncbi:hypothetical protein Tco_1288743, partial [Tanacetum coccineum]
VVESRTQLIFELRELDWLQLTSNRIYPNASVNLALGTKVLLGMLSHLATVLSALARHPASTGKELMSTVETFILELLNLTKDSILEAKRIQTQGSEVLKASQVILDAVICLCKAYCNSTKSDDNGITEKDVQSSVEESDDVNQVLKSIQVNKLHLYNTSIDTCKPK